MEKEEQKKPKVSRRKEIIKIREEINKIEIKNLIKPRVVFFFFLNGVKINKPLARLTKKQWEKTQINKIRHDRGENTTNTAEIQKSLREYYK